MSLNGNSKVKDSTNVTVNFKVTQALSATITPTPLNLTLSTPGTASGTVTVTPSGGVAPYTYSWNRMVGGTRSSISNANVANPSITATLVANDNFTESWRVLVTDSANTQVSTTVAVNFQVASGTALSASLNIA